MSKLNNKVLLATYSLRIDRNGYSDFLMLPERKESLSHDFPENNGEDIDLTNPKFKAREFRLGCFMEVFGSGLSDVQQKFWNSYNGLFTELMTPGTHELFIDTLGKTYSVFYKKQLNVGNVTITEDRAFLSFDLVFGETDPDLNIPKVYLVDHLDRFLIA